MTMEELTTLINDFSAAHRHLPGFRGAGWNGKGITVFLRTEEDLAQLPLTWEGYPLTGKVVGEIRAL